MSNPRDPSEPILSTPILSTPILSTPILSTPPAPDGRRFVVQRHRATRLHYDVRLEVAGVLVSWAVPKGPTLDPSARRLAVRVDDHSIEHFDFEGVISRDEYGGGDVIVWDWGGWELAEGDDPMAQIDLGSLHFDLHGHKLGGRFVLVRRGRNDRDNEWLLIHKHDDAAVVGWNPEDHPRSVMSGLTNDQIRSESARRSCDDRMGDDRMGNDRMGNEGAGSR